MSLRWIGRPASIARGRSLDSVPRTGGDIAAHHRCVAFALLTLCATAAAHAQPAAAPAQGPAAPHATSASPAPAYLGLRLRQSAAGVVVVGVQPGPLGGDGFTSPSIWRGDLVVAMNDAALDAAGYAQLVRSLAAGDRLRIAYRRSRNPDPYAALPAGDPDGEARAVEVVLDDAQRWTGSIGRVLTAGRALAPAMPGDLEAAILDHAGQLSLREPPAGLDAQLAALAALQQRLLDPNALAPAVHALERPLALDRVEASLAAAVRPLAQPRPLPQALLDVQRILVDLLDLPALSASPDTHAALLAARVQSLDLATRLFADLTAERALTSPDFPRYLQLMRSGRELMSLPVATLPAVARHAQALEDFAQAAAAAPQRPPDELAQRVSAAVEGPVLGAMLVDGALWIVGGEGPNRYDMGGIAAVFDLGGNDSYVFSRDDAGAYRIVVDQAGDDLYASAADGAGSAAAVLSVSVLEDRAGDDRYLSTHRGALAAAAFGIAILIDAAGDDEYRNDGTSAGWAQGAAIYGAALLIDRAGDDRYRAQILAQGVGGPGGFGLLLDVGGDDDYLADGPHFPSSYGTRGVFAGLSQGLGVGLRGYAAGGVGALYDLGGNDRYTVGEFGQGTGYFQGLGVLHDADGDDVYVGARYAQGSAAHQAGGILVDAAGDDDYSCIGPAAQGAAWDQGVALLLDRAGHDSYRGQGLAQAAAAQQSVAVLADLDGEDYYACAQVCQGEGGINSYHQAAGGLFNFGALLDRGGDADTYSHARTDGALLGTGIPVTGSACCGLFIDD
jgi:hypothetical protein